MKVSELIKELEKMPQEAMVIVSGYEAGVNEVTDVKLTNITLNVHTAWYYGKHEENKDGDIQAVYLT